MSETETKSAYRQEKARRCRWCVAGLPIIVADSLRWHYASSGDPNAALCTAPSESAFAQEQFERAERLEAFRDRVKMLVAFDFCAAPSDDDLIDRIGDGDGLHCEKRAEAAERERDALKTEITKLNIQFNRALKNAADRISQTRNSICQVTGNICGTDTWAKGQPCQCASCRAYLERAEAAERVTARYSNPWTVEVQNVQTGSWLEVCHDAPLTLADAEQRMKEHQADSPDATFRVAPWLNPQQRQHVEREKNAIRERLAASERLAGDLAEALRRMVRAIYEPDTMGGYVLDQAESALVAYDRAHDDKAFAKSLAELEAGETVSMDVLDKTEKAE